MQYRHHLGGVEVEPVLNERVGGLVGFPYVHSPAVEVADASDRKFLELVGKYVDVEPILQPLEVVDCELHTLQSIVRRMAV